MANLSFRSKTVFHSLPEGDPETPPTSKMELIMTIDNGNLQSSTLLK